MTVLHFTRRTALGLIGIGLMPSRVFAASGRPSLADASAPYQVPGGRIGFVRPQGVAPSTNGWILQSDDHTFQVRVQEAIYVPGASSPLWDADAGRTLTGTPQYAGFTARRFKDLRYEPSLDYSHECIVMAGDEWLGEISVSTSNLDELAETTGLVTPASGKVRVAAGPETAGLVARWKVATDLVLGTITVRPRPPADVAMAEFGIGLDVAGLNARFAGDRLILSAHVPRNGGEVLGTGIAHIALPAVSNLGYIEDDANAELFDFFKMTGTELTSGPCRAVVSEERRLANGFATTGIRTFGKRRQQEMTAVYPAAQRAATLEALERTYKSLRFLDEA